MTGMEDVLAAHVATTHGISGNTDGGYQARRCQCGSEFVVHYSEMSDNDTDPCLYLNAKFAAHVAEALTAAGFGNLHDAWDSGYTVGNAHNGRRDANPYPKVSES